MAFPSPMMDANPGDAMAWDNVNIFSAAGPIEPFPSERGMDSIFTGACTDVQMRSPQYIPQHDDTCTLATFRRDNHSIDLARSNLGLASMGRGGSIVNEIRKDSITIEASKHDTEHALECEAQALVVLKSLQYIPTLSPSESGDRLSSTGSSASSQSSLQRLAWSVDSMDTLLTTNKTALNELTQMMNCRCADNPHIALLHMTILSKIVFWYNVAVTTRCHSDKVELKPMRIQFGALDLDDEDYETLHRAALGRELHKAGNVIRAFESRFASSDRSDPCGNASPWNHLTVRAIQDELDRCLCAVSTGPTQVY